MTDVFPLARKRNKVAIVGFCQPHRDWAPYDNNQWDIWGLNRGYIFMPRADMWFEMHGRAIWEWEQRRPGNHVKFLQGFRTPAQARAFAPDMPVIMHEAVPSVIPHSIAYPFEAVAEDIGRGITRFVPNGAPEKWGKNQAQAAIPYLASSIAQEIALAIYMGYEEIALFGIDLNTTSEYAWQKPGVEHLLGLAAGRGIKVHLPDMCPLLRGNIYGRGYKRPEGESMSLAQVEERLRALQDEHEQFVRELQVAQGGLQAIDWVQGQMIPGLDHELMEQRKRGYQQAINQWQVKVLQNEGALNETLYWAHITPDGQPPDDALKELALKRLGETGQAEGPTEGSIETMLTDAQVTTGLIEPVHENGHAPAEMVPA